MLNELYFVTLFTQLFSYISYHFQGCAGGDSCCTSGRKCYEGEGDCDTDDDCMPGLRCGQDKNYCRVNTGHSWDTGDDCCYRPCK